MIGTVRGVGHQPSTRHLICFFPSHMTNGATLNDWALDSMPKSGRAAGPIFVQRQLRLDYHARLLRDSIASNPSRSSPSINSIRRRVRLGARRLARPIARGSDTLGLRLVGLFVSAGFLQKSANHRMYGSGGLRLFFGTFFLGCRPVIR